MRPPFEAFVPWENEDKGIIHCAHKLTAAEASFCAPDVERQNRKTKLPFVSADKCFTWHQKVIRNVHVVDALQDGTKQYPTWVFRCYGLFCITLKVHFAAEHRLWDKLVCTDKKLEKAALQSLMVRITICIFAH